MSHVSSNTNFIVQRKINIATYLNTFFPNVISKLISEYDYYLEGKSYVLPGHSDKITKIVTLPDGRIASSSLDKTIKIWNLQTGLCDVTLTETSRLSCLSVLPDGRIVIVLNNTSIKIWNPFGPLRQPETKIYDIAFHTFFQYIHYIYTLPDGHIIIEDGDNIDIWKPFEGLSSRTHSKTYCTDLIDDDNLPRVHNILPDGRIIMGLYGELLGIYNTQTNTYDIKFEERNDLLGGVELYIDGRIIAYHFTNGKISIKLWNIQTGKCEFIIPIEREPNDWVSRKNFKVLPDGRIITVDDNVLKVFNLHSRKYDIIHIAPFDPNQVEDIINVIEILPDGRIASCLNDKTISIWS
jgi:WD40 repeat protein